MNTSNENDHVAQTVESSIRGQEAKRQSVIALGNRVGFGYMMTAASELWGELLQREWGFTGGQFIVGPCVSQTTQCICVTTNTRDQGCEWCAGCGWVTKKVSELQASE